MTSPLVLSLFPGIGLLDTAFELEGFCVVRGPDVLWGGDIRSFHPPVGKFDGVIGGPPCQRFSSLSNINRVRYGEESLAPNLIPEFERCIGEAQPEWFLMENVPRAPVPQVPGYGVTDRIWNNQWNGGTQERVRRFSFGLSGRVPSFSIAGDVFKPLMREPAVTSNAGGRRRTPRRDDKGRLQSAAILRRSINDMLRLQGLPPTFLSDAPFTTRERMRVVGNGVPLPMGRAIARAVKQAITTHAVGDMHEPVCAAR
jgi:DNA (cytosine-5)-methyltransferase 1